MAEIKTECGTMFELPCSMSDTDIETLLRAAGEGWQLSRPGLGLFAAELHEQDGGHDSLHYIVAQSIGSLVESLLRAEGRRG